MGVLLWKMVEAKSPDPAQQFKWRVYWLLRYKRNQQEDAPVEVVMALPAPGK